MSRITHYIIGKKAVFSSSERPVTYQAMLFPLAPLAFLLPSGRRKSSDNAAIGAI